MDKQDHIRTTAPSAIAAMLELHLSNWQELLQQLQVEEAPAVHIDYCQTQIERLRLEALRVGNVKLLTEIVKNLARRLQLCW